MNAKLMKTLSIAVTVLPMLTLAVSQVPAQGIPIPGPAQIPPVVDGPSAGALPATYDSMYSGTVRNDPRAKSLETLRSLLDKLRTSNEENRQEITKEVETALTEYFDRDMEHRKSELERLTKRAEETEARLKKREESRDELIDLQLKSYQQDADGLGLFGEQSRHNPLRRSMSELALAPVQLANVGEDTLQAATMKRIREAREKLRNAMNEIREAREKLRNAKTEEDETAAVKELETALGTYFDGDLEQRRKELEDVREELKQLDARLKKRTEAKAEIIALQLKMFINEANGLGFFSGGVGQDGSAFGTFWPARPRSLSGKAPSIHNLLLPRDRCAEFDQSRIPSVSLN